MQATEQAAQAGGTIEAAGEKAYTLEDSLGHLEGGASYGPESFELPVKLAESVYLPEYAHGGMGDAGMDLAANEDAMIPSGELALIPTGISVAIPSGIVGKISLRSSIGKKKVIIPNAPGIIDPSYRGEVKVMLLNLGREPFRVTKGDRLAQIVFERYLAAVAIPSEELDETERGEGGFGSTGI